MMYLSLSAFRFPFSAFRFPFISYPLPLRVLPLSQGEKVRGHLTPETRTSPTSHLLCHLLSAICHLYSVICTPDNPLLLSLRTGTSHRG